MEPNVISESERSLWDAFHTHQTDTLRVKRADLNAYVEEDGGRVPPDLVARPPRTGSTTVDVRRSALWTLLTGKPHVKQEWNK